MGPPASNAQKYPPFSNTTLCLFSHPLPFFFPSPLSYLPCHSFPLTSLQYISSFSILGWMYTFEPVVLAWAVTSFWQPHGIM